MSTVALSYVKEVFADVSSRFFGIHPSNLFPVRSPHGTEYYDVIPCWDTSLSLASVANIAIALNWLLTNYFFFLQDVARYKWSAQKSRFCFGYLEYFNNLV